MINEKRIYFIVAILQTIIHYLGIIGIGLGIIAFLFDNKTRGWELLIGGISFIVLKYIIGVICFLVIWALRKLKKIK